MLRKYTNLLLNGTCGFQGKRQIFSRLCCVLITWTHLWLRQTVLALLRAPDGEADLGEPLGRLRQPAPAALRLHARDLHLVIFFVETLNNIFLLPIILRTFMAARSSVTLQPGSPSTESSPCMLNIPLTVLMSIMRASLILVSLFSLSIVQLSAINHDKD